MNVLPEINRNLEIKQLLQAQGLWSGLEKVADASHYNPYLVLGSHFCDPDWCLLVFRPFATRVWCQCGEQQIEMTPLDLNGLFFLRAKTRIWSDHPLMTERRSNSDRHFIDPYTFHPQLDESRLAEFKRSECFDVYHLLGAHLKTIDGVEGVRFSVWAPNASRVSVVGDFNQWDSRYHAMTSRGESGVWELFVPECNHLDLYKYEIKNRNSGEILLKSDPYSQRYELRPDTASRFVNEKAYSWRDKNWMRKQQTQDWLHQPLSIYELHLGSWKRGEDDRFLTYVELVDQLIPYVKELGFTHIELLPISEFPYDGSWGYQVTGYFAPSSRFGSLNDFKYFVDQCHKNDIGVLLDWVPAHFPKDAHGLARFDGTFLYEHEDPQLGEHKDWGTLIFNYGRNEVRNFLFSSAYFWLKECHIDGLRVDAVASMLYLDYSRDEGEWTPNCYGGNENLDAIHFLRRMNERLHGDFPGVLIMAEESTAWPQVSRPVYLGGLGFTMKWNMGWMNDSLSYMMQDPVYRPYHHEKLTFSMMYAFSENFILPFSHDEVVHGKHSMLEKMPGDIWQQFASVRLLYTYMYTHPGKKLLFMGDEFGQGREWRFNGQLDWELLQFDYQKGLKTLVGELNKLYCQSAELHQYEFEEAGFEWIDCHDKEQSVISFMRRSSEGEFIVVLNFTPVVRHGYRIGVPAASSYGEIFNSDSFYYSGSNVSNGTLVKVEEKEMMGFPCSIELTLPPLAGIILKRDIGESITRLSKTASLSDGSIKHQAIMERTS